MIGHTIGSLFGLVIVIVVAVLLNQCVEPFIPKFLQLPAYVFLFLVCVVMEDLTKGDKS